jgi:cytoskeletal protein RodZ
MAKTDPQERSAKRRKRQSKAKSRVSYSFVLLSLMLIVGCISGLVTFVLGQKALQGVNPIPLGGKLPSQAVPTEKPSKKANTNSYWDDDKKTLTWAAQDELGTDVKNNGSLMSLVHPTNANNLSKNSPEDLNINAQIQKLSIHQNTPQNKRFLGGNASIIQSDVASNSDIRMDVLIAQQTRSPIVSR